jgi:hypothetical protein
VVAYLAAVCGIVSLAACVMAGAAAVPRGGPGGAPACALRIDPDADAFAVAGEVGAASSGEWTLRALAHDGSVSIVQSGPVMPGGEAGVAVLPGDPAGYDLAMTVDHGGRVQTCPVITR